MDPFSRNFHGTRTPHFPHDMAKAAHAQEVHPSCLTICRACPPNVKRVGLSPKKQYAAISCAGRARRQSPSAAFVLFSRGFSYLEVFEAWHSLWVQEGKRQPMCLTCHPSMFAYFVATYGAVPSVVDSHLKYYPQLPSSFISPVGSSAKENRSRSIG